MLEILLVDDESTIRLSVGEALRERGHRVVEAKDGEEAKHKLADAGFDLVLTDVRMPKLGGMQLFRHVRETSPRIDVILMTAYGEVEEAVEALKAGAADYLTKPIELDELVVRVQRIEEKRTLQNELQSARAELRGRAQGEIVGRSPAMTRLLELIDTVARSDASVLIMGETGTGKELVAKRIHDLSARRDGPLIAINCAAFPETLLEAELFGHEAGAFTGAVKRRDGRFVAADHGTILLDEVGEIPPMAQAKLLRVLQEGVVEPLGTNEARKVDVRVLSATNRDLRAMVKDGTFREDLYYRLNVLDVSVPALRDRVGDLPLLVQHFLERFSDGPPQPISPRAWAILSRHPFYGNVRELEHAVIRAAVLSRGQEIQPEHLPGDMTSGLVPSEGLTEAEGVRPLSVAVKEFERTYIERALVAADGKKARAADMLAISRKNLWEKCKSLGIDS